MGYKNLVCGECGKEKLNKIKKIKTYLYGNNNLFKISQLNLRQAIGLPQRLNLSIIPNCLPIHLL